MARASTVSSSRSGTAPGRWSRARTLTWMTRSTTTRVVESSIRLKRMGVRLLLQLAVDGHVRRGGDRHGHRRRGRWLGFRRQYGVARVLVGGLDDDSDDVELRERDERPDVDGAGQVAAGRVDAGDDTDGYAGHERPVGLRAEGDQPVTLVDLGLAVEQLDAQRLVALSGGEAEFVGGLHARADGEVGVVGEQHGGGVRADRGDAPDQSVSVEDGHVAGDTVAGAHVDRHGPGEALGRSYGDDLGALDAVLAGARRLQHLV